MSKEKVLLVEFDKGARQAITILLELNDINVVTADDCAQAMGHLNASNFDLVICSVTFALPENGAILGQIKDNQKHYKTPVVILADTGEENEARLCMNLGADDFITKPVAGKALISIIKSRLEVRRKTDMFHAQEMNEQIFSLLNKNFNQEILTPLNGIMNTTVLLETLEGTEGLGSYNELIHVIHVSCFRMQRTTQNLKMYSILQIDNKIDSIPVTDNIVLYDLLQLIAANYEEKYSYGNKKLDISIIQDGTWRGQEELIKILFTELIDNAIKFTGNEYIPQVKLEALNKKFNFTVTNCTTDRLSFSLNDVAPFQKFNNDLSRNGMGLGLFICKSICEKLGYRFFMSADAGKVTFNIECD